MCVSQSVCLCVVWCRGGSAINLDADLLHGRTEHCDTFNNEPLVTSHAAAGLFAVAVLEVFAFH